MAAVGYVGPGGCEDAGGDDLVPGGRWLGGHQVEMLGPELAGAVGVAFAAASPAPLNPAVTAITAAAVTILLHACLIRISSSGNVLVVHAVSVTEMAVCAIGKMTQILLRK
jgi:hypothetical protein